jgi:hypothetical protein
VLGFARSHTLAHARTRDMGHARGDTPHACLRAMLRVFLIMLVLACLLTHAHGMPSGGPIVTENVVIVAATTAANAVAANQASRVETTLGAAVDMGATVTMAESSAQGRARLNEEQEEGVKKLSAKSRADLQKMCRDRNLSTNGNNKGALATRIFIYEDYVKGGMEPAAAVERLKKRKQPSQRKQGELNAEAANQHDVHRDDDGNLVTLLTDEDLADIQAIDWSSRSQSTINEYGFALNRFKAWLLHPEQVTKGFHGLLSNKDINGNIVEDPVKNWRQRALDLSIFNVEVFKLFVLKKQFDEVSGVCRSFSDSKKYVSAICWSFQIAKMDRPTRWNDEMLPFLKGLKSTWAEEKQKGNIVENKADPMPMPVLQFMCLQFFKMGDFFACAWMLLQWNCVARSQSIAILTFEMFCVAEPTDSIRIDFNKSKTNQGGDASKLHPKHVYANTLNPAINVNLMLGLFLCDTCHRLDKPGQLPCHKIFPLNHAHAPSAAPSGRGYVASHGEVPARAKRANKPSVSKRFEEAFHALVLKCKDTLVTLGTSYCADDAMNLLGHSLRKGPATYASTAEPSGCSIMALLRRGDWSVGSVMDAYVKWAQGGDQTVGRTIAGLPPSSVDFAVLPPHFKLQEGHDQFDDVIKDAVLAVFGRGENNLPAKHEAFMPVLYRLLASMVYHADWVKDTMNKGGDEAGKAKLMSCELYRDEQMLNKLKPLVVIDPMDPGTNMTASGITQTTHVLREMEAMRSEFRESAAATNAALETTATKLDEFTEWMKSDSWVQEIHEKVTKTLEEGANERGVITADNLKSQMAAMQKTHEASMQKFINESMRAALRPLQAALGDSRVRVAGDHVEHVDVVDQRNDQVEMEGSGEGGATLVYEGPREKRCTVFIYKSPEMLSGHRDIQRWHVPLGFQFPSISLQKAYTLWMDGVRTITNPIRPFRLLVSEFLPSKKTRNTLSKWKRVMTMLDPQYMLRGRLDNTSIARVFDERLGLFLTSTPLGKHLHKTVHGVQCKSMATWCDYLGGKEALQKKKDKSAAAYKRKRDREGGATPNSRARVR